MDEGFYPDINTAGPDHGVTSLTVPGSLDSTVARDSTRAAFQWVDQAINETQDGYNDCPIEDDMYEHEWEEASDYDGDMPEHLYRLQRQRSMSFDSCGCPKD